MNEQQTYPCDPMCWVEAYSDELFRFAFARVGDREEAEDLVQDTFFSALKNLENFRRDCSEKTWLYNILKNRIVDFYRRKAAKSRTAENRDDQDIYSGFFKPDGFWDETRMPKPWSKDADQDLSNEEFLKILAFCMERLPNLWSSVFSLKSIDDKTTDEICKDLGITSSNLWVIIHRAKLQLRGCIEKNWFNS
ncbi:sigma-70 family RNA polymerase sigma factor [Saccharicrinis sp. FJH54]|uniref:sigma-70 family RNA polymerase sigma factor n=1 Tax=Saccharicrinis sp. FJH54 TaxID=3344665 RepID=UPI0035D3F87E